MASVLEHFDKTLVAWAMRKFKQLKGHKIRACRFLEEIAKRQPNLFVHWRKRMARRLLDGSGVSREAPAPFCERLGVRSPRPTHHRLHWRLDVVMNEDQDRSRLGNAPHNLAVLRHMALNVMQKDGEKGSLRGKIKRAGWDETYLAKLLTLF